MGISNINRRKVDRNNVMVMILIKIEPSWICGDSRTTAEQIKYETKSIATNEHAASTRASLHAAK